MKNNSEEKFGNKILEKKYWKWKKKLGKKFWKKNIWIKNNDNTINQCETIFALLARLDMNRVRRSNSFSLHRHAKPSFAHRLQTAKIAFFRTSVQNMALGRKVFKLSVKCFAHGLRGFNGAVQRHLSTQMVTMLASFRQVFSEV